MMDRIGTPEIIDLAIVTATILLGLAGFWRGVVKESLISGSLVLGYLISLEWGARWGSWIGEQTSLSNPEGQFAVTVASLAVSATTLGYLASINAGLPPADMPGRIGGFAIGVVNAVFVVAVLTDRARQLILTADQQSTLSETRLGWRLSDHVDLVILGLCAVAIAIVFISGNIRKRRAAIVQATGLQRQGASGFQIRRPAPLAPEAEKIDRQDGSSAMEPGQTWTDRSPFSETVHLRRVQDSSTSTDRPHGQPAGSRPHAGEDVSETDVIARCVSCGERITGNDRFCPRCGRLLIR